MIICPVCYEEFKPEKEPVALKCGHTYHAACIKKWFATNQSSKRCPLCRTIARGPVTKLHMQFDEDEEYCSPSRLKRIEERSEKLQGEVSELSAKVEALQELVSIKDDVFRKTEDDLRLATCALRHERETNRTHISKLQSQIRYKDGELRMKVHKIHELEASKIALSKTSSTECDNSGNRCTNQEHVEPTDFKDFATPLEESFEPSAKIPKLGDENFPIILD